MTIEQLDSFYRSVRSNTGQYKSVATKVDDHPFFGLRYFNVGKALKEFKQSNGSMENLLAGTKLAGKVASNIGLFFGEVGADFFKDLPKDLMADIKKEFSSPSRIAGNVSKVSANVAKQVKERKGDQLSDEQRCRLDEIIQRAEEREEDDGEIDDQDEDEVEGSASIPLSTKHYFFYSKAAALRSTSPSPERALLLDAIDASMRLPKFLEEQHVPMSDTSSWWINSDSIELESLIYAIELIAYLLSSRYGVDEPQLNAVRDPCDEVALEYAGGFKQEAEIAEQAKTRQELYGVLMREDPQKLHEVFHGCLTRPSAIICAVSDESQLDTLLEELVEVENDALSTQTTFAYMRDLSGLVVAAVARYAQQLELAES